MPDAGSAKKPVSLFYHVKHGFFDIVWLNVVVFTLGHLLYVYSFSVIITEQPSYTLMYNAIISVYVGISITAGAHRLWSHRSYKARLPFRIFLMIGHSIAGQNCLFIWCRDHIIHHKYSDTDGDPHNVNRGFFFSHVGWLFKKRHPELIEKGKKYDFTELLSDPVVEFQRAYYYPLYLIFAVIVPIAIPCLLWGESWTTSFLISYVQRYITTLHITWFINSSAHMFGDKPYNGDIKAVENRYLCMVTLGEHHHNYHHTFPQDYATSELDFAFNATKWVIDVAALFGQAYDLKRPSMNVVEKTKARVAAEEKARVLGTRLIS